MVFGIVQSLLFDEAGYSILRMTNQSNPITKIERMYLCALLSQMISKVKILQSTYVIGRAGPAVII